MSKERLVVIGNGMAGARLVADLLSRGGGNRFDIAIFGDEPCGNYNRILLSSVLSRSHKPEDIFINPLSWYAAKNITLHAGTRVEQIDLRAKRVIAAGGVSIAWANAQQHSHAVPGPLGYLGGRYSGVEPERHGGMP